MLVGAADDTLLSMAAAGGVSTPRGSLWEPTPTFLIAGALDTRSHYVTRTCSARTHYGRENPTFYRSSTSSSIFSNTGLIPEVAINYRGVKNRHPNKKPGVPKRTSFNFVETNNRLKWVKIMPEILWKIILIKRRCNCWR